MKKYFAMALLVLAGGAVFAQNLRLTGQAASGLHCIFKDADSAGDNPDPALRAFNIGGYALRLDLRGSWTDNSWNAGMRFRLYFDKEESQDDEESPVKVYEAMVWGKFFDGLVQLNAGYIQDRTFMPPASQLNEEDMGEGLGATVLVKPFEDLTLGLGAFTDERGTAPPRAWVQAVYTLPDVFKITGGFAFHKGIGGTTLILPDLPILGRGQPTGVPIDMIAWNDWADSFGLGFLGLEGIGITNIGADIWYQNYGFSTKSGLSQAKVDVYGALLKAHCSLGQKIDFAKDPVTVSIRVKEWALLGDITDTVGYGPMLFAMGTVSWKALPVFTVRLDGGYLWGGWFRPDAASRRWRAFNVSTYDNDHNTYRGADFSQFKSAFFAQPAAVYTIGRATFELGVGVYDNEWSGEGSYPANTTKLQTDVYLDCGLRF
jgi:hypothetical protein